MGKKTNQEVQQKHYPFLIIDKRGIILERIDWGVMAICPRIGESIIWQNAKRYHKVTNVKHIISADRRIKQIILNVE